MIPATASAPRRRRPALSAWLAWCVVVLGVLNSGAPVEGVDALKRELHDGVSASAAHVVWRAWRLELSDYQDLLRYQAYADAVLGRPYRAYFVRSEAEWQSMWRSETPDHFDLDEPLVHPARPLVPWRDFLLEYPPGFLPCALAPALLTSRPTAYALVFSLSMGAAMTLALRIARRLLPRMGGPPDDDGRLVWVASALVLALGVVSTHRFDAIVSLSVVAALAATFSKRPWLAGVLLGAGAAAKLVPAFAALPIALYLWHEHRPRDILRVAAAGALTTGAAWVGPALTAGAATLDIFRYHAGRPLEIESTGALLVSVVSRAFGLHAPSASSSYGSVNLQTSWTGPVTSLSHAALFASFVAITLWTHKRLSAAGSPQERCLIAAQSTVGLLAASMLFGTVFSPQYVVWLLPLGLVVASCAGRTAVGVLLLVCLLTQLVFPVLFWDLGQGDPIALAVALARNGLLLAFTAIVMRSRTPQGVPRRLAAQAVRHRGLA
jgi:hypothetical protein